MPFWGRGTFHAGATDIEVGGLKLQRGRELLPRLAASGIPPNKVGVVLWAKDRRLPVVRGVQIRAGEILCLGPGVQSHHRTSGPNEFTALIMNSSDLLRAANELTSDEITVANGTVLRPPDHQLTRLLSLIESAIRVSRTTPEVFASPQATKSLEQALLQPMIECLLDREVRQEASSNHRRAALAKRFEEAVEANLDDAVDSGSLPDRGCTRTVSAHAMPGTIGDVTDTVPGAAAFAFGAPGAAPSRPPHHDGYADCNGSRRLGAGRFAVTYKSLFGDYCWPRCTDG